MRKATTCILLDLDGTISDPIEGIWRSLNHALKHFGHRCLEKEETAEFIGPPLDEGFVHLVGSSDPKYINKLVVKYRERFALAGYAENRLYPGIKEVLFALHDQNVLLGICTSKREDFAVKILEMFGLLHIFAFVSGGDVGIKKTQQISELLSASRIPKNTIMVGDRAVDLLSAHQNHIISAGVLWGYGSKEELVEQSPKYLFEQPAELLILNNSEP